MRYILTYKPYGERSILVEWSSIIDENILQDVLYFKDKIYNNLNEYIVEINSAYNSLLVVYANEKFNFNDAVLKLKTLYKQQKKTVETSFKIWSIPVCYDEVFGLDLVELSQLKNLSKQDIIGLHAKPKYTVYFIGFLPGFLYLGGLKETLSTPRKKSPRLVVQKGAVAIGGDQTGVYPQESPGGWNIIGNSPINFFDASKEAPCFAKSGDRIKFYPISKKEYNDIKVLVDAGVYQIESKVVYD